MESTSEPREFNQPRPAALSVKYKLQDERFQKVIVDVEDYAVILLDQSGSIVSWNKGAARIKGYTAEEIIGRSYKVFYSKEDRDAKLPDTLLSTAKENGKAVHEGWRIRKDGTRFWGSITITAIRDNTGSLTGYLKITRDLSELKIAEDKYSNYVEELKIKNAELTQSEERYHKMIAEVADYVIILLDETGKVQDWNKGAEKIKGYKSDEIIGKSFRLFYTKEDKDAGLPESLLKRAEERGSVTHEGWRIRKDGTRFWSSVALTALHNNDQKIFGFSKVTRDLTDAKIAEDKLNNYADELAFRNAELLQSEERYHKMVAEVQDYAIFLLDTEGKVLTWNAGAEYIKGYKADEILGSSFELFYTEEDQKAGTPGRLLGEAAEKGRVNHEGWRVRKDGSKFWSNVVITALHNENNDVIGFSKVSRDLTAKKERDDLILANSIELDRRNKALERANEEMRSFAYVASHDLKEPLRKIRTFASRVLEANDIDNARYFTEKIERSAARMQKLMDDLSSYSQVSSDRAKAEKLDLYEVMTAVKTDLDLLISESSATFNIEALPVINGVDFQIHQMFVNLVSNSLKFAREGVPPVISMYSETISGDDMPFDLGADRNQYFKVTFADNGIGFEDIHSKKIFEVFQRLHSPVEVAGTGIGLAIVKRIMENHNGFVVATGTPGIGARFDLYFPSLQSISL